MAMQESVVTKVDHPLEPLREEEILKAVAILKEKRICHQLQDSNKLV